MTTSDAHLVHSHSHRYYVPLISQDLTQEEALTQSFDALKHVDKIINDVFTRLQDKIKYERERLSGITGRVQAARQKVELISQNESKVTTIFSSAKFPAVKELPDFERVCGKKAENPAADLQITKPPRRKDDSRPKESNVDTKKLLHEVISSRVSSHADHDQEEDTQTQKEGLGRLPAYLPSVSSALLFNSDENLYKKYQSINNLEGVGGIDKEQEDEELAAAPHTLLEGTNLPVFGGLQFEYKPDIGEVPTFDLPTNLPLGKLADINFGGGTDFGSIAPSLAELPSLPTLPALSFSAPESAVQPSLDQTGGAPAARSAPPPPASTSSTSAAPPPPPARGAPAAPPMAPAAPPMAPPVAPGPPAPAAPRPAAAAAPAKPSGGGGGGGQQDLLSAIRDSKNRSKLKRAAERVVGEDTSAAASSSSGDGGGDMMSALKARLNKLRVATTGKNPSEKRGNTMADVVVQAVRATPSKDESDEDDEDDWE